MKILFIGNYQTGPGGEPADETHITRELEAAGHEVTRVNRDEWREYVIEEFPTGKYKVPEKEHFDIAVICKWHHFYDGSFIEAIKMKYGCPVFYWVWDWMGGEEWHIKMAQTADLLLSGEMGAATYYRMKGIKYHYFQFDSCDGEHLSQERDLKDINVVFLGSCTNQNNRLDILKEINKEVPIRVYGYDTEEWEHQGFDAHPAVYGYEFNSVISRSKIVLGTSANHNAAGYWSNRVGKVLHANGFLLQWYTPGMESIIGPVCDYFSSAKEAVEKIKFYLSNPKEIDKFKERNVFLNRMRWTSAYKVDQLLILMERYLKDNHGEKWILP